MKSNYYIAALPKLNSEFYKKLESLYKIACYPEIRLPFHTTLYYFGEITESEKFQIENWLEDNANQLSTITASVRKFSFFEQEGKPYVYYFELFSPELEMLHVQLQIFSDIRKDSFSYIPHLSLFFPKLQLTKKDEESIDSLFKNLKEIEFKGIYLGSVVDNITKIHTLIEFKENV